MNVFHERLARALDDAAENLALAQERIDHDAHVVHRVIAGQRHLPGRLIDLDFADMGAVGVGHRVAAVIGAGGKARLQALGQGVLAERLARHFQEVHRTIGADDGEPAFAEADVGFGCLQQTGGDLLALFDDAVGRHRHRGTRQHRGTRPKRSNPLGHHVGVAVHVAHQVAVDAQPVAQHLPECRGVPLAMIHGAAQQRHTARGVEAHFGVLVVAARGRLHQQHHAHAEELAALARLGTPLRNALVVCPLLALDQRACEIAAVVSLFQRRGVRHGRGRNGVAPAQLRRIDAELARRDVDDGFSGVERLGPATAPIEGDAHGVGEHAHDPRVDRLEGIRVGQAADRHHRGIAVAVGGVVGADRTLVHGAQREEFAFLVERELRLHHAVARLLVAREAFAALGNPLDRPAGELRRPERKRVLGRRAALHAEAAAHGLAHYAQPVVRDLEYLVGQGGARAVRGLDGGAQGVALVVGVVLRQAAARLERVGRHPVDDHLVAHDALGPGKERLRGSPVPDFVGVRLVSRVLFPQGRRTRRERLLRGDHGGQGLVLHFDQLGGVFRLVQSLGHDEGDRLADVAHALLREQRLRGDERGRTVTLLSRHDGSQRSQAPRAHVVARQYGDHARSLPRRAHIYGQQARMRVRRAQHASARFAGKLHVVDVTAPALQQPWILLPRHCLSYAKQPHARRSR